MEGDRQDNRGRDDEEYGERERERETQVPKIQQPLFLTLHDLMAEEK